MSRECVNIIGTVRGGFPSPAEDFFEEEINLEKFLRPRPASSFLARVVGDSMKDACIPDNAIIIVDRAITAKDNDVVVAVLDGEFTLKYLRIDNGNFSLVPANKHYPVIPVGDGVDFRVWGVVTKVIVDLAGGAI